jgi:hypothetical protein
MAASRKERLRVFPRPWAVSLMAIGAMMVSLMTLSAAPQQANAYTVDYFCPSNGSVTTIPAGGRCVDYRRLRHRYIEANILWGGVGQGEYCAGAKANPDGTGANTKGFGCSHGWLTSYTYSGAQAAPGSPLGYATIINNTGASDLFVGVMHYYP